MMTSNNIEKKIISKYMSELAKLSHKKNKRPRSFYQKMAKLSHKSRLKKLSTINACSK